MVKNSSYLAKHPDANGHIDYDEEENAVWQELYARQIVNVQRYAARAYLDGLQRLDLPRDRVPQCAEVSASLTALTGWRVEPVPALIGFGRFFSLLSNRTFPAASFIRRREDFDYIEEPDIFHEIFGHTPLLTDQRFADFSHAIGCAGVQAATADYAWLIRLYWFTIEFGLVREQGQIRALGSGLASSPVELTWSVESEAVERRAFDVLDILRTPYRIDIPQPIYFVLETVDDLLGAARRDLLDDVRRARSLGEFAPVFDVRQHAS